MQKLELTFTERFHLIQMMPQEDSHANLIICKSIKEKINITPKEEKENNFSVEKNILKWTDTGKKIKVEFNPSECNYLRTKLKEANANAKLNIGLIDVYTAIV